MRQSIESMSQQIQMLTHLVESLSRDHPTASSTSGDKRGISAVNPTPTKEPQSVRQKTPTTECQVQSVPMASDDDFEEASWHTNPNAWENATLQTKISRSMAAMQQRLGTEQE